MDKLRIGEKVLVVDHESWAFDEWGVIKLIDSDGFYHVAIANNENQALLFDGSQVKRALSRRKKKGE